mgnify:CR=1 FL=1
MGEEKQYIVSQSALPTGLRGVCEAKSLLRQGKAKTVAEAVRMVGISRSVYYRYRDSIRPFLETYQDKILTIQAVLQDRSGVLSTFLNVLAKAGINVLTVNQNIPVGGEASVSLSVHTGQMRHTVETVTRRLLAIDGVVSVHIQG